MKRLLIICIVLLAFVNEVTADEPSPTTLRFDDQALTVYNLPRGSLSIGSKDNQVTFHYQYDTSDPLVFMAHSYLSGKLFFGIELNETVQVVFFDKSVRNYVITNIERYQVKQGQWMNLDTQELVSETVIAGEVLMGDQDIALMTCIRKGRDWAWGRQLWFGVNTP